MLRNYGMLGIGATDSQITNDCIEQNTGHDGRIFSQLQGPEALDRYQEQLLRSTRPEKHIQQDYEDGEAITLSRGRYRMNLMQHGNELGDQDQAYKPEIVNDPVPWRLHEERPSDLFQKGKRIDKAYSRGLEAQKDSITQFPEYERGYKYSDAWKYIPGEIRTINKITMDSHTIPMYSRSRDKKIQRNFKNQVEDIKTKHVDPTMTLSGMCKKKIDKVLMREHVEPIEIETNVNEIYEIVARKRKPVPRLPQDLDSISDDTEVKEREWQRPKPKKMGFINPGIVTDSSSYFEMAEAVQNIESKLKKGKQRPNLGFRTLVASSIPEKVMDFKKKREKNVERSGYLPDMEWVNIEDEDGIANPEKVDRYVKKYSSAMLTKIRKEDVKPDMTSISDKFKKKKESTRYQSRKFAVEILEDDTTTNTNFSRSKPDKKGNLSFAVTGQDLLDSTEIMDETQKRNKKDVKTKIIGFVEDGIDTDVTRNLEVRREKSKRTRVNRNLPVGTITVNADPYNEYKKSGMHPSEFRKRVKDGAKSREFDRAKIDILGEYTNSS